MVKALCIVFKKLLPILRFKDILFSSGSIIVLAFTFSAVVLKPFSEVQKTLLIYALVIYKSEN